MRTLSSARFFPHCRQAASLLLALGALLPAAGLAADQAYRLTTPVGPAASTRVVEPYQTQAAEYRLAPAPESATPPRVDVAEVERPFAREVSFAAAQAGVEAELVHALIAVESAYRPDALSPKGAVGLMQLLPGTAQRYGVFDLASVPDNLRAGTRHLRSLLDAFGDRLDLALAAYNAGEGAVRKYKNTIPPYRETRDYVPAVLKRYRKAEPPPAAVQAPALREYLPGTRLAPDVLKLSD